MLSEKSASRLRLMEDEVSSSFGVGKIILHDHDGFFLNDIHLLRKIYVSDPYAIVAKIKKILLSMTFNNNNHKSSKVS